MAKRWVKFVGVSPLLLGGMVAVPQMVAAQIVQNDNMQNDNKVVVLSGDYPQTQDAQLPGDFTQIISSAPINSGINLLTPIQGDQNNQTTEAQRLYREGEQLRQQGTNESLQQALAKFQEALPLFRASADRNGEAENLEGIGNVYLGLRQGQTAIDYYQQALQIYRQRGNSTEERFRRRYGEARTLTNLGSVQHTFSMLIPPRFRETTTVREATTVKDIGELSGSRLHPYLALNFYQQALPIWRELGSRGGEADTLNYTADVYQFMRQNQQALSLYQQALQIYREVKERSGEAATLNDIAFVYQVTNQRQQALNFYQQALKIYREMGDRREEAKTLKNIEDMSIGRFGFAFPSEPGRLLRFGGETTVEDTVKDIGELSGNRLNSQIDINFYQQVLSIWREVVDSPEERLRQRRREAATLKKIALVYRLSEQPQQALSFYQQAIQIYRELGDRREEAKTLSDIAFRYRFIEAGIPQAINFYQQAIQVYRELGDRKGEAATLSDIAFAYRNIGQYQQALSFYEQSLQIYREVGDRPETAKTLDDIATTYQFSIQPHQALSFYQQALPIWREVGDRTREARTLDDIGEMYLRIGQPEQALNFYQQALPIWREQGSGSGEANTLDNIARVYRGMGKLEQALNYSQQASAIPGRVVIRTRPPTMPSVTAPLPPDPRCIWRVNSDIRQPQPTFSFGQQALSIFPEVIDRNLAANTPSPPAPQCSTPISTAPQPPTPVRLDRNRIWRVNSDNGQPQPAFSFGQQAIPIFRSPTP